MLLRSGREYDAGFPQYLRDFCRFDNPWFGPMWDCAATIYHHALGENVFDKKQHKVASRMFQHFLTTQIRTIYETGVPIPKPVCLHRFLHRYCSVCKDPCQHEPI